MESNRNLLSQGFSALLVRGALFEKKVAWSTCSSSSLHLKSVFFTLVIFFININFISNFNSDLNDLFFWQSKLFLFQGYTVTIRHLYETTFFFIKYFENRGLKTTEFLWLRNFLTFGVSSNNSEILYYKIFYFQALLFLKCLTRLTIRSALSKTVINLIKFVNYS